MNAPAFLIACVIFACICLGFAATGTDPDPVTMGLAAFLSGVAGAFLA